MGKKSKSRDEEETNGVEEAMDAGDAAVAMEPATYEDRIKLLNPIAKPLAGKKLTKKIYKLIKKACKDRNTFYDGLRQVQYKLRKGEKGLVIFAGDVYPVDIMIHLPAVCEDEDIPYVYVPSRKDIGLAMGVNRTVIAVMIKEKEEYAEAYNEIIEEIKTLPVPW